MNGRLDWMDRPSIFEAKLPQFERASIDILMCPPSPYLHSLSQAARDFQIATGGQTCHSETSGAHTGEVSAPMLKELGASYVIVGHSERRALGKTNEQVKAQAKAAIDAGLIPIICVGESLQQREAGTQNSVITQQIQNSIPNKADTTAEIVIAYEPIWAIGTGKTASPEDILHMHAHIRAEVGEGVRLLYGGSVKPSNAAEIFATDNVNGALIGGASLKMESFAAIARHAL